MASRLNLLPSSHRCRAEHRRQAMAWVPVWAVVFGLLCVGQFALTVSRRKAESTKAELLRLSRPLQAVEQKIQEATAEASMLDAVLTRQESLEQADLPLIIVQLVADACETTGGLVSLNSFRVDERGSTVIDAKNNKQRLPNRKRVVLAGLAESDQTVAEFVRHLRDQNIFADVKLDASQSAGSQEDRRTFEVVCEL